MIVNRIYKGVKEWNRNRLFVLKLDDCEIQNALM